MSVLYKFLGISLLIFAVVASYVGFRLKLIGSTIGNILSFIVFSFAVIGGVYFLLIKKPEPTEEETE